ncbi:MAG: hypothetical protein ACI9MC_003115 [Kiritimatiellia bacterium]|jgi:hypothetical protein
MRLVFVGLLAMACGPATASIFPISELPDNGTGSAPGSDTDVDTETDTDTETEAPREVEGWSGVRNFDFGSCDEAIDELGVRMRSGPQVEACPRCDYVFEVEMLQDRVCGIEMQNPAWRGVQLDGRRLILYWITQDRRGDWEAEERSTQSYSRDRDGIFFEYGYDGSAGWNRDFEVEAFALLIEE